VVLAIGSVACPVVPIVIFKLIVDRVSGTARSVHVRRIKNDAIKFLVLIWKIATVHATLKVSGF
jgi:hypothetical protein